MSEAENQQQLTAEQIAELKRNTLQFYKERIQFTEGVIIAKKGFGLNATITLRRVMQGIGVERVYLVHSPKLKSLEIVRGSKVRRAKLYYLRSRFGKATRLQQRFD